jgi:integrase
VEALRPEDAAYRVPDRRSAGLAVRVATNGLKTWDVAFRINGTTKSRRLSLGRFPDVGLEQARKRADDLTRAARAGRDLQAEEEAAQAAAAARLTIGELVDHYVRRRVTGRLKTAKEIESRLKRALAELLDQPADEVRRRDIGALLDRVSDEGLEREAEKRRQTVGAMFRWAVRQDLVDKDPTAGLTAYDPGTPRDRVLTVTELVALWAWLDHGNFAPDVVEVLRLQIATGARCGEVAGIEIGEIDSTKWLWTLPGARSKNGRARVTPIVGLAGEILKRRLMSHRSARLFNTEAGTTLTASHVGHALLHRRDILPIHAFTTHDIRRSVATGLVEMGVALDLVAAVIGHDAGGPGTRTLLRHYVRTDLVERKCTVLEAWDVRLRAAINGSDQGQNVLHFHAKA